MRALVLLSVIAACGGTRTCPKGTRYDGKSFSCDPTCAVLRCAAPMVCGQILEADGCQCPDLSSGDRCEMCEPPAVRTDDMQCRQPCKDDRQCPSHSHCLTTGATRACVCESGFTGASCDICVGGCKP